MGTFWNLRPLNVKTNETSQLKCFLLRCLKYTYFKKFGCASTSRACPPLILKSSKVLAPVIWVRICRHISILHNGECRILGKSLKPTLMTASMGRLSKQENIGGLSGSAAVDTFIHWHWSVEMQATITKPPPFEVSKRKGKPRSETVWSSAVTLVVNQDGRGEEI